MDNKTTENINIIISQIKGANLSNEIKQKLLCYLSDPPELSNIAVIKDQCDMIIYALQHLNKWIVHLFPDVDKRIEKLYQGIWTDELYDQQYNKD